eukprot:gene5016-5508_t
MKIEITRGFGKSQVEEDMKNKDSPDDPSTTNNNGHKAGSSSTVKSNHRSNNNSNTTTSASTGHKEVKDEHNEVCEVCERGGDLICCDTCSLVFHLKCIRPKLPVVPKGDWSCPYCVLDDTVEGDKSQAKLAIQAMGRLTRGYESDDDAAATSEADRQALRLAKTGEITIAHSGRKFIVRRTARKQIVELGRYSTLEEALDSISSIHQQKHSQSNRNGHQYNHGVNSESDDKLWCTFCQDDPLITVCAFCGCKACFGKYDSHLLVLCDECERETHAYCLNPPQNSIPAGDPWYCASCGQLIAEKEAARAAQQAEREEKVGNTLQSTPVHGSGEGGVISRGRGRPPGSAHIEDALNREFTDEDFLALEYHRHWASLSDLQTLCQALIRQQTLINQRLGGLSHSSAGSEYSIDDSHDLMKGELLDHSLESDILAVTSSNNTSHSITGHKRRRTMSHSSATVTDATVGSSSVLMMGAVEGSEMEMPFDLSAPSQDPALAMSEDSHFLSPDDMLLSFKDEDDDLHGGLLLPDHLDSTMT